MIKLTEGIGSVLRSIKTLLYRLEKANERPGDRHFDFSISNFFANYVLNLLYLVEEGEWKEEVEDYE